METRKEFAGLGEAYAFLPKSRRQRGSQPAGLAPARLPKRPQRHLDSAVAPATIWLICSNTSTRKTSIWSSLTQPSANRPDNACNPRPPWPALPQDERFDCIVSHHVLYYVPKYKNDPEPTLDACNQAGASIWHEEKKMVSIKFSRLP